jgi:hypothetical protein
MSYLQMKLNAVVLAFARGQMRFSKPIDNGKEFFDGIETHVDVVLGTGRDFVRVSIAEILVKLPQHIMSAMMLWEQGEQIPALVRDTAIDSIGEMTAVEYVCHSVRMFVLLCPALRLMQSSLVLFDTTYTRQVIDSMTLILLAASSYGKLCIIDSIGETVANGATRDVSAFLDVIPTCIQAVMCYVTERNRGLENRDTGKISNVDSRFDMMGLIDTLSLHPRGWLLIQSAMEATRTTAQMLALRLRQEYSKSFFSAEVIGKNLEYSLELLEQMFAQQAVYSLYLEHDPNASEMLRLLCSCLELVSNESSMPPFLRRMDPKTNEHYHTAEIRDGELFYPTDVARGAAENSAAWACAFITSIGEHSPSFCDLVSEADVESQMLSKVMVENLCEVLNQILMRPGTDSHNVSPGESMLTINCLRAGELISDDSNFKSLVREKLRSNIANMLAYLDPPTFESFWGPGTLATLLMVQDPTTIGSTSEESQANRREYIEACRNWDDAAFDRRMSTHKSKLSPFDEDALYNGKALALERTILLIKIIGNLQMDDNVDKKQTFVPCMLAFAKSSGPNNVARMKENMTFLLSLVALFGGENAKEHSFMSEFEVKLTQDVYKTFLENL